MRDTPAVQPRRALSDAYMFGSSLIITMIMLIVIGLTAAGAIRNATSSEKLTNNIRMQSLAQQYAEAGLRYCEDQMAVTSTSRVSSLQDANVVTTTWGGTTAWSLTTTWTGSSGGASASRTNVPSTQISSSDSSFVPTTLPQCVVERQILADGKAALVITARGFSPDYSAKSNGTTASGSVVWLQSMIYVN